MTRFLQPHKRQVTRILQFSAQATHELVPGDVVEPVLKTIANNFITERNSTDVMAIGLNAVRMICSRCPLAMGKDLLRDLVLYKAYKEKSVMMAARSLITLYREQIPALLHKKDRGRLSEAQAEMQPKQYGAVRAYDHVPGADALLKSVAVEDGNSDADSDSDSESWVDVNQSGDEININTDDSDSENSDNESEDGDADSDEQEDDGEEGEQSDSEEEGDEEQSVDESGDEEEIDLKKSSAKTSKKAKNPKATAKKSAHLHRSWIRNKLLKRLPLRESSPITTSNGSTHRISKSTFPMPANGR